MATIARPGERLARPVDRADELASMSAQTAVPKTVADERPPGLGWLAAALLVWALATSLLATLATIVLPLGVIAAPILVAARGLGRRVGRWQLPPRRWRRRAFGLRLARGTFEIGTRARGFGSASST